MSLTFTPTAPLHSLPRYVPLQLDASATFHLLVAQAEALPAHTAFTRQLAGSAHAAALVLGEHADLPGIPTQCCRADADLEQAVRQRLLAGKTGMRLYLCGDEDFIWGIHPIALTSGLGAEEIHVAASGARRRVYCVHCGQTHSYAPDDEVTCAGCDLRLAVRQHFSRLLGAYLGACANPDAPERGLA